LDIYSIDFIFVSMNSSSLVLIMEGSSAGRVFRIIRIIHIARQKSGRRHHYFIDWKLMDWRYSP
jgi:hypothetical protein